jgi:hypothetical protein
MKPVFYVKSLDFEYVFFGTAVIVIAPVSNLKVNESKITCLCCEKLNLGAL